MEEILDLLGSELKLIAQTMLSLYIVVNPSGVSSVFLGLTKTSDHAVRRSIAFRAALTGGLLLALFALAGTYFFQWFRISGAALQIAGGIFVFGVAFALARGKEQEFFGQLEKAQEMGAPKSVAYYPLAVPLIAGPASITIVMTLSAQATTTYGRAILLGCIAAVALLSFLSMGRVLKLEERLGPGLAMVLPRIMGLVLAVIAIQFIIEGIEQILPRFVRAVESAQP